jgi:hypothetical protein
LVINPIANRDQFVAEETALRVLGLPQLQEARRKAAFLWRLAHGVHVSAQALETFEDAMDEWVTNYVIKAVASDTNNPRFVRNFMPPHEWAGRKFPGARIGGDNPDNCYRFAAVAHGARYAVHGRAVGPVPASVTFTLVANFGSSVTVQTIDYDGLEVAADGSFTILIDGDPPAGRPNHLRTIPPVKFLFVRDSLGDWTRETPIDLTIDRLDAPLADPLSDAEIAGRAIHRLIEDIPLYYWFTRLCTGKPVNTMVSPIASGQLGGLVGQAGTQSCFKLADDEAAVLTIDPAGAKYAAISACDWWFRSLEYWDRTASFTHANAVRDPDGCYTFVLSGPDPGIHNWVDTCGRHEILLLYRWQGLPNTPVRSGPAVRMARVVKLAELDNGLPQGTAKVTPRERAKQLEWRRAGFARRLLTA